jgi:hypothetical protein
VQSDTSGHSYIQCFERLKSLATQQFFQLWEEIEIKRTHIRTMSRVRQCFPPVTSENILYHLWDIRSCTVMERAVTFLFCNTSVKTRWTDDFGIPDSTTISSHVTHLSFSKMVPIIATHVFSVKVLGLPGHSSSSVLSWPWRNLWDQREFVLNLILGHHTFPQQLIHLCWCTTV